jgi:hypothetical protein
VTRRGRTLGQEKCVPAGDIEIGQALLIRGRQIRHERQAVRVATHQSSTRSLGCLGIWLEVRILSGPPRSSALNEISWRSPNTRDFAGVNRSASSLCKEEGPLGGSLGPSVSGVRKPFPGARGRRGQRLSLHATKTGLHTRASSGLSHRRGHWAMRSHNFRTTEHEADEGV